jgi:RHH-type rel operon transcriptional repressor/antitoxin RelB
MITERDIEALEDYCLAADVLERVRKGQEQTHSADDLRKHFRLDDRE